MSSLPESYDREVIQMVHTGSTDSAFLVGRDCRRSVRPGDFVETVARDGQVESGVVLHHDKGLVSLYTADGRTIELLSSLVTFTVKNLVNRTFMDCLEEEGSPSSPLLQHLSNYLKLFIRSSINLSVKMKPYMDVVYAQTASARGIRGVSFDQILRDLFENARIYRPISPSMGLCAYLLLKESSFGRFCADSPEFFPLPERSPEGVDDVLKSYLVYPDPKLQPFVNKNMSELYPERDTDSWLTAPNSVYQMLKETGKIDGNPLLVKGSNFWKTSDGEIHDDVEEKLTSMLNKGLRKKSVLAHKEWNELPVYAFSHSHDIAFSLDMRKPDSWTLYLHIIDLSHSIGFQDGPLLDLLQYRGKSVRLKEGMRSLFPESFRFRTGFTRANNQPVQCLTLSVEIQPWEPVEWNMGHVNAQFTSINNSAIQYFDGQKVDESMGWKYERIGDELFNILDIKEDKSSLLTINRATRYHLTCIREIIEKHYWKRMDAAQIPSNVQTFEDQTLDWYSGSRKIVQEARIFAGHLCSLFGLRERLKLPSIDRSLGLPSYTEVGYPMDSLFSMIPQWQIRNLLERRAFEETNKTLVLTKPTNIETYIDQKIRPQDSLIDYLYNRIQRFHKLSNLQDKIRQTSGYYIFRCIVNEDAQYPHIASAFCPELDMDVEVVLVPNARLYAGDRILCNQIQEISPVDGLLVLCI
ncbi:hypothetical protein TRICI_005723 [Trichomonascus ciferrii]|uniref:Uncharacterized protein n=1 Tax=Trichomonascus ciferrii TaxID=44093 RepID=A0A642URV1_9ASCO|nr:hypothetical protein TRICI_005723 [Trichomonascus ciferrii]